MHAPQGGTIWLEARLLQHQVPQVGPSFSRQLALFFPQHLPHLDSMLLCHQTLQLLVTMQRWISACSQLACPDLFKVLMLGLSHLIPSTLLRLCGHILAV